KVIDVQALMGDPTDNVPGVRGIGPKTAAELINTFGSLENLLDSIDQIKQEKRRLTLQESMEDARISKRLVTLDVEAPLPKPLDQLGDGDISGPALAEFLSGHGFKSVLARLGTTTSTVATQSAPVPAAPVKKSALPDP